MDVIHPAFFYSPSFAYIQKLRYEHASLLQIIRIARIYSRKTSSFVIIIIIIIGKKELKSKRNEIYNVFSDLNEEKKQVW